MRALINKQNIEDLNDAVIQLLKVEKKLNSYSLIIKDRIVNIRDDLMNSEVLLN